MVGYRKRKAEERTAEMAELKRLRELVREKG